MIGQSSVPPHSRGRGAENNRPVAAGDKVLKRIAVAAVKPSNGPPYVRCGLCRKQVFADGAARTASVYQVWMLLRARLSEHLRDEHGGVR